MLSRSIQSAVEDWIQTWNVVSDPYRVFCGIIEELIGQYI